MGELRGVEETYSKAPRFPSFRFFPPLLTERYTQLEPVHLRTSPSTRLALRLFQIIIIIIIPPSPKFNIAMKLPLSILTLALA